MIKFVWYLSSEKKFDMTEIQNLGKLLKIGRYHIKCFSSTEIAGHVENQHQQKCKMSHISKSQSL